MADPTHVTSVLRFEPSADVQGMVEILMSQAQQQQAAPVFNQLGYIAFWSVAAPLETGGFTEPVAQQPVRISPFVHQISMTVPVRHLVRVMIAASSPEGHLSAPAGYEFVASLQTQYRPPADIHMISTRPRVVAEESDPPTTSEPVSDQDDSHVWPLPTGQHATVTVKLHPDFTADTNVGTLMGVDFEEPGFMVCFDGHLFKQPSEEPRTIYLHPHANYDLSFQFSPLRAVYDLDQALQFLRATRRAEHSAVTGHSDCENCSCAGDPEAVENA